jgi:hypothetical protein
MPPTSLKPKHEVEPAATSTWATNHPINQNAATDPSSTNPPSCAMSCRLPLKPNVGHSTTTPKKESHYERHSPKWAIRNHPPLYKLTTPPQTVLPTNKSSNKNPNPWTCDSIGFKIESPKNNSKYTGDPDQPTSPTISRNTIPHHTIGAHDQLTYTVSIISQQSCEGVLTPTRDSTHSRDSSSGPNDQLTRRPTNNNTKCQYSLT